MNVPLLSLKWTWMISQLAQTVHHNLIMNHHILPDLRISALIQLILITDHRIYIFPHQVNLLVFVD